MPSAGKLTITFDEEISEKILVRVAARVSSTEQDVIADALDALDRDDASETSWLRDVVAPTYDRMKVDPGRGLSGDAVRAALADDLDLLSRAV